MLLSIMMTVCEVEDISDLNVTEELKKQNWTMVRFFAPWCAYSQISEPVWNDLAKIYDKHPVRFVNVNCNKIGRDCREKYEMRGYPTWKLYKNGRLFSQYRATWPRELDVFTEWLNREITKKKE